MLVCLYALRGFTRPSYISTGGREGEGGEGERGGEGGGVRFWLPSHRQPEEAKLHRRTLGSHRGTPPPSTMVTLCGGQWGGD